MTMARREGIDQVVRFGVGWTIIAVGGVVVWVIFGTEDGLSLVAGPILLAPLLGAVVASVSPWSSPALVVAAVLTGVTAVLLLIGGIGLLFIPPAVLFTVGAVRGRRRRLPRA